jgi:HD-GYP domain-containing protein (c-di-GMP phosphodiesterase class II)
VAREMNLSEDDIKDIILAGYLHDVGMLGLSVEILYKKGKLTEVEFESMRLHSDVGSSIIETTLANDRVASYVRHHHERWDGFGYPDGIKGEEIPIGARIIAVVDMFVAKLTGRKYREASTFESTITDLRFASGSQLDPAVVEALISWFEKKQLDRSRKGRSLGPCWEMKCCHTSIARQCPAYGKLDVNCWEIEGVNCAAHGNTCQSCMVHTEFVYRTDKSTLGKK